MNFLNPAFLFALAAAAVPVIIHLLSRRRRSEVRFSSLRFLERSDRQSMRRISVRRLLLLAMRVAAVALVALAFARPVITGRSASLFPGREPKAVAVLIDRSYSMGARIGEGTAFDEAAGAAMEIAGGLGDDDELTIALFDESLEEILSAERSGGAPAGEALEGSAPSWRGTDLRRAFDSGLEILSRSRMRAKELFLVSDFQRTSLRSGGSGGGRRGGDVRIFLVPVSGAAAPNVSINDVILPGSAVHRGEAVEARVLVRNNSEDRPAASDLRIELGGRMIMEKQIELPPGATVDHGFEFDVGSAGWIRGSASCREDILPADDMRLFSLRVRERTPVLLIAGGESYYLSQALLPDGADGDIALVERDWSRYTTADLESADVVVAGPAGAGGAGGASLLRRYAAGGGRLVVFISPGLQRLASNLSSYDISIRFRDGRGGFASISPPPGGSPLLSPFDEDDLEGISRLRFAGWAEVAGLPAGKAAIEFLGGDPFLWVEKAGDGAIIFVAAEPVPGSGDLVLSPYFLPLVQSIVLSRLDISAGSAGALVGGSVKLPFGGGEECAVTLPGGVEFEFAAGGGAGGGAPPGGAAVPAGEMRGYLVVRCGEERWETAVNPDCELESSLERMTPREAADSLGIAAYAAAQAGVGMSAAVREAREGREIADLLIAAAAILLAAELSVAQGAGGRRGEVEDVGGA